MNSILRSFFILFSLTIVSACLFLSCTKRSSEGMIVMTQLANDLESVALHSDGYPSVAEGGRIMMIDPKHPDREALWLTKGFYSACSPDLSFDAKKIVFTGQKTQHDPWQIYEMNLANLHIEPLTNSPENCIDPVYVPGDKIIYTKDYTAVNEDMGRALFTMTLDGRQEDQITFSPGSYTGTAMLHDGRIISTNLPLDSDPGKASVVVMRPDGTKEMLFYKGEGEGQLIGKGKETEDGEIYLLEKNKEGMGMLFSVSYNNPLNSKKLISEKITGDFIGMSPLNNGRLLVCYRKSKDEPYGLFELNPENSSLDRSVFKDPGYTAIEAIAIEPHKTPKNIPSEVNMEAQTALLLCQDINFMGFHQDTVSSERGKAVKIEVLGLQNSLGTVDVEKDGSVYLKMKADTPFQLQTLNEKGEIVNGPSSWINLRPNERRACVGCHQGNQVVPHNRQPLSVLKEPVLIPREPKLLAERE